MTYDELIQARDSGAPVVVEFVDEDGTATLAVIGFAYCNKKDCVVIAREQGTDTRLHAWHHEVRTPTAHELLTLDWGDT